MATLSPPAIRPISASSDVACIAGDGRLVGLVAGRRDGVQWAARGRRAADPDGIGVPTVWLRTRIEVGLAQEGHGRHLSAAKLPLNAGDPQAIPSRPRPAGRLDQAKLRPVV